MKTLHENWITEKWIDFEYKKYILLAYLKQVSEHFDAHKLYPFLAELIAHHKKLLALRDNRRNLTEAFPKDLKGLSLESMELLYEQAVKDDDLMREIEEIVSYSIPQFEHYLDEGRKIYDFVEAHMHIFPVGVLPLYPEEGYMILEHAGEKKRQVFEYRLSVIEEPDGKFRAMQTNFITDYERSISHTLESIKNELLKARSEMPNPATYAIESDLSLPLNETFLPLAKRMLIRYIYNEHGLGQA